MALKWFSRFKEGTFELPDSPRSGRRVQIDENQLQALIKEPQQTARELAQDMVSSHIIVDLHLHSMSKLHKDGA